jgi:hypothetical protein
MRHPDTGHEARIASAAVPHARRRGWLDATDVPDVRLDEPAPVPDPEAQEPDESGWTEE